MRSVRYLQAIGLATALSFSYAAWADDDEDIEGRIEAIDPQTRSFVVNGMVFHVDDRTDYDDELNRFADLRVGQRVEVDYVVRDGNRYAREIELDD